MFVVVQHPLTDARAFSTDLSGRVVRPTWPMVSPGLDFVRSTGAVQQRHLGGVSDWEGEDLYCDASMALRFPNALARHPLEAKGASSACHFCFRRYFSQGTLARLEVGFRLKMESATADQNLHLALAWLALPVTVGPRRAKAKPLPLIAAGRALAAHFLRASTLRKSPPVAPWWLQAGTPAVILEAGPGEELGLPPHTTQVPIPGDLGCLHHAWLQIDHQRVSTWILTEPCEDSKARRHLRIHLLRLHAEREALRAILTLVLRKQIDITSNAEVSDTVQRYLNDVIRALQRPQRFSVQQAEMITVAQTAFENLFEGDTATLSTMRTQVCAKVRAYLDRARTQAATINHYHGDYMSTTIQLGNVTVSGDFNIVTAKSIENSFNKAASATDPKLAEALKALSVQVADLSKQLPQDKAEQVAGDLETLTKEATAKAPRRAWYELSANGLLDAAKTVAAMAAPVATAVKAVLALLA